MSQTVRVDSLISSPSASFEQPFDMLHACHERMQRMLALLQRLRAHIAAHGADEQARQAARDVLRYFELAAPQHHHDEELHIFPPLQAQGDPATQELVGRLQQDHLQMEARWVVARRVLSAIEEGRLHALSAGDEAALEAFTSQYADHIAAEEQVVYPAAMALLDPETVQAMGREMAHRREAG
jgi:hemerythrin-like domain-containing protein